MYLGLFGTYRKDETIDLQFQRGGKVELVSDLPVDADDPRILARWRSASCMLTDHSEAVNGKLYMVGGGWNVLRLPELPHEWSFHIALGLDVAWDETNQPPQPPGRYPRPRRHRARRGPRRPTSRPAGRRACPPARTSAW